MPQASRRCVMDLRMCPWGTRRRTSRSSSSVKSAPVVERPSAADSAGGKRKREREATAASLLALDAHLTAPFQRKGPREIARPRPVPAEAPSGGLLCLSEGLEDGLELLELDPHPGVLHLEFEVAGLFRGRNAQADEALRRELQGVAEQVDEDLPQAALVSGHHIRGRPRRYHRSPPHRASGSGAAVNTSASRTQPRIEKGRRSKLMAPESIFEKSRTSLTM